MFASVSPWGGLQGYSGWPGPQWQVGSNQRQDYLRIAFLNDIHEKYGAFERIIGAFNVFDREAQQQGIDFLKLSAGDWNAGIEANELELGGILTDMAGVRFTTPGNHELDVGLDAYARVLNKVRFRTIATNFIIPQDSSMFQRVLEGKLVQGPVIYRTPNGVKYGFVGLTTPHLERYLNPDVNLKGASTQSFETGLKRLQQDVNFLRAQGINRIIAITHCGDDEDVKIAERTSGIDIIIGGHSHKRNTRQLRSASGEPVTIIKTRGNGREFSVADFQWDARGWAYPVQTRFYQPKFFPAVPAVQQMVDAYLGPAKVIGRMAMDVNTENTLSMGENGVANRVADAMRMATGAEIAMFRGTELRNDITKGDFTDRDLRVLLPFSDNLVTFKMTGAQILTVLNESARCLKYEDSHPGIMHTSGLKYVVDKRLGKVVKVEVYDRDDREWEPLELNETYTVSTGEFAAKNSADYSAFKKATVAQKFPFSLRDAFGAYIVSQRGKSLSFPTDGRLTVINAVEGSKSASWQPLLLQPGQSGSAIRPWSAIASAHGYTTSMTFSNRGLQPTLIASA